MIFETVKYDAQLVGDKSRISFFAESEDNSDSVTAITEEAIIKWLLEHRHFKEMFLSKFFKDISSVQTFYGLTDPFVTVGQKPGDIDLLLVNPKDLKVSIAFEVKRLKALAINEERSKVNGVEKISKGVIQANKYQSLGFHQSYLMLIILNDGRLKNTPNVMLRSAKTDDVERIYSVPWDEPLHSDVGIIFIDINQFTGRHISQTGSLGICIDKYARPLEQTHEFTRKVERLFLK